MFRIINIVSFLHQQVVKRTSLMCVAILLVGMSVAVHAAKPQRNAATPPPKKTKTVGKAVYKPYSYVRFLEHRGDGLSSHRHR